MWRCRGSNPGPFTCKANALPLSHIPQLLNSTHLLVIKCIVISSRCLSRFLPNLLCFSLYIFLLKFRSQLVFKYDRHLQVQVPGNRDSHVSCNYPIYIYTNSFVLFNIHYNYLSIRTSEFGHLQLRLSKKAFVMFLRTFCTNDSVVIVI